MQKPQPKTFEDYVFASGDAFLANAGLPSGIIDHIDSNSIAGWCIDPENPHALVDLELRVSDVVVAHFRTGHPRADIAQVFGVETPCGFRLEFTDIPPTLAKQALDTYSDHISATPAANANLRVTLNDRPVELLRWKTTGNDFANVNPLYVLRSQDSLGGVKVPPVGVSVTRTRQGAPAALPAFASSIPSDELPGFLAEVIREKSFYLLQGLEQRFHDETLDRETLLMVLNAGIASKDTSFVKNVCKFLADNHRIDNVSVDVLLSISELIQDQRNLSNSTRTDTRPDVVIAAINVTRDVLQRQKVIIDTLCSRLGYVR